MKQKVFSLFTILLLFFCSSLHASTWEPPTVISGGGSTAVDIACDDNGNVVAVWQEGSDIMSAYRPAGGLWESPMMLTITTTTNTSPKVCIDGNGTLTAVWINTSDASNNMVDTAHRVAGSGTWVAATTIASSGGGTISDLTMDCIPSGRVGASWFNSFTVTIQQIFRETTFVWGGVMPAASGAGVDASSNPIMQFIPLTTSPLGPEIARVAYFNSSSLVMRVVLASFTLTPGAFISITASPALTTLVNFDFALNDTGQGILGINSGPNPQPTQSVLFVAALPIVSTFQQISSGTGLVPAVRVGCDNNGVATAVWADGDGTIHSGVTTVNTPTPSNVFVNQQVTEGVPGGTDSNPRFAVSTNGGMVLQWFRTSTPSNEVYHKVGFGGIFEPTPGTPTPTSIPAKPGDVCMSNNGTAFAAWQLSQGGDTFIEASKTIPGAGLLQQGNAASKKRVIFQRGLFN